MYACMNIKDAARKGDSDTLLKLINACGAKEAFKRDKLKRLPLHLAAWEGHIEVHTIHTHIYMYTDKE